MSELVVRTLELLAETKGGFVSAVKNIFNTRTMATLKISDLSIGDYVCYCDRVYKVYSIEESGLVSANNNSYSCPHIMKHIDYIDPIPITAEILEKNGFEEVCGRWYNSETLMGFEKPRIDAGVTKWEGYEPICTGSYTLGELIEMLPEVLAPSNNDDWEMPLSISTDSFMWTVEYDGGHFSPYEAASNELIDALYDMVVRLKADGVYNN